MTAEAIVIILLATARIFPSDGRLFESNQKYLMKCYEKHQYADTFTNCVTDKMTRRKMWRMKRKLDK